MIEGGIKTYRTVTTLLAQVSFKDAALELFSLLELANACIHALGHVLVLCILGLWNVEKLESQFADLVRRATDNTTPLALDAACNARVLLYGPLIEARNVDFKLTAIRLPLVVLEADIGPSKRAIWADQIMQQVPSGGVAVGTLCHLACFALLLRPQRCNTLGFLLLLALGFLALLRGLEQATKGRVGLLVARRLGSRNHWWSDLGLGRGLQLGLKSELKLEVVQHDQLKLLADGRITSELQPSRGHAVETIVKSQLEPGLLVCNVC